MSAVIDDALLQQAVAVAKQAGGIILKYYGASENLAVRFKADRSPVTEADVRANEYITCELTKRFGWAVISEETPVAYEDRRDLEKFWLTDPLDGTKDFLAQTGHFTVNIALIENRIPTLGVIYAPAEGWLWCAKKDFGAFLNGRRIFNNNNRERWIAADSVFHSSEKTREFLQKNGITQVIKFGSAVKFGKLAEGVVDLYPRFEGSKEWDIAAGHCILKEAGCNIIDWVTEREPVYNKPFMENNFFMAARNDILDFLLKKSGFPDELRG